MAYKLVPTHSPLLLAAPSSSIAKRGVFATKHLWVTPHGDDGERPGGPVSCNAPVQRHGRVTHLLQSPQPTRPHRPRPPPAERYPAGDYPMQHAGGDGLPKCKIGRG